MNLDGGIHNDLAWQAWWSYLVVKPLRCYEVPSGKVRCRFVRTLGEDLKGVRDRRWNSEQFIVFQNVILKQARDVTASQAIRRQI